MYDFLFDYYLTVFEVIVILLFASGVAGIIYWGLWRRRQKELAALRQELADVRAKHDRAHFEKLHDHLQSAVAHEFITGLDYISRKSEETLKGLEGGQVVLRDKLSRIIVKAHELIQHAINILNLFALEQEKPQQELLSIRQLLGEVLVEFYPYAEGKGVVLRPTWANLEPAFLNRSLTLQAFKNVIHNAIKYSHGGGAVEVALSVEEGETEESLRRAICVKVKDRGKGIEEGDRDKIFELGKRGDGLIEPGSGLGLYCAREAACRQGGDVILVDNELNRGSTFKIVLPYHTASD